MPSVSINKPKWTALRHKLRLSEWMEPFSPKPPKLWGAFEHTVRLTLNPVKSRTISRLCCSLFPEAPLLLSRCLFSQTQGNELAVVSTNLLVLFILCFRGWPLCLGLERLAALSNLHTHTHVCCCNASWEFGSHCDGAWALASVACVEAYAFDFEQLRVFEYVGEGTK